MTMDLPDGALYVAIEKNSKLGTLEGYLNAYKTSLSLSTQGYIQRACAFNLAAMQISLEKYAEGLEYLKKALPPEGKRDGKSNGDLFFNFGLAHEGLKNTSDAKKYYDLALEEYKSERANIQMEAATVQKIGRLYLEENEMLEADNCLTKLITLFSNLGDFDKEMQAKIERASVHLSMRKATEAQEIADGCIVTLNSTKQSLPIAKHYTDLAVIYTQLVLYDKAIDASMKALQIMEGQNMESAANSKLLSVLYQNLGAVHNFKGEFDLSIEYHRKATEGFAKDKERLFQGHCFTNMGYAYSQLKNMEKAKEYFLHGLQAAKEEDDFRSQWQNLEALACVAFHDKNAEKAEEYLKEALSVFPKSKDSNDTATWNRLNKKYRESIALQVQPKAIAVTSGKAKPGDGREGDLYTDSDHGDLKIIRRGSKIKYLKVRRSGTLRRFNKVALGLDPNFSISEGGEEGGEESSSGSGSEESGSETDEKLQQLEKGDKEKKLEGQEKDETKSKRPKSSRPPDSYLPRSITSQAIISDEEGEASEELKVQEDSNESDEDSKNVKDKMRQYLSLDAPDEKISNQNQRQVQADVHAQAQESEEDSSESEDSSSDTDSSPERRKRPPVPSLSPQPTDQNMRTYETVGGGQMEHDHHFSQKPPRNLSKGERSFPLSRHASDLDGPNYFHEDGSRKADSKDMPSSSGIYATIQSVKNQSARVDGKDSDGNEIVSEGETEKMSRAERDVVLYNQFKHDLDDSRHTEEDTSVSENAKVEDKKKSRACILM